MLENYYRILQVDPEAEPEVIEAAYKRLAHKYHPDRNPAPTALERMKQLNAAYDVLSDPAQRHAYDQQRRVAPANPSAARPAPPPTAPRAAPPTTTAPLADEPSISFTPFRTSRRRHKDPRRFRLLALGFLVIVLVGGSLADQYLRDHRFDNLGGAAQLTLAARTPTARPSAAPDLPATANAALPRTLRSANLYTGPSPAFALVTTLEAGVPVKPIERTADTAWYFVRAPETNLAGWISGAALGVSPLLEEVPVAQSVPPTPE